MAKLINIHNVWAWLLTIAATLGLLGCASDNVHQPEPEPPMPANVMLTGTLSSGIPAFPTFEPVVNAPFRVDIVWTDAQATRATVMLDAFSLYVSVVDSHFDIGAITVTNVAFAYDKATGTAQMSCPEFQCQAGQYFTTGSLTGTYDPSTKKAHITVMYKPGSMPFMVQSIFTN